MTFIALDKSDAEMIYTMVKQSLLAYGITFTTAVAKRALERVSCAEERMECLQGFSGTTPWPSIVTAAAMVYHSFAKTPFRATLT